MTSKDVEICVPLKGDLGLKDAQLVLQGLSEALDIFDHVSIDAGEVTGLDISIVQLLVAARKSAARQGKSLTLDCELNRPLCATLAEAGLPLPDSSGTWGEDAFWLGRVGATGTGAP